MDDRIRQATRLWTVAQPVVSAFVESQVRDFAARDDVLQETAVAVIDAIERYDPNRPFLPWALGIAQNQVRLYLRRLKRDKLVFSDELMTALAETFAETPPEEIRALGFLRDCLAGLDHRSLALCELRYVQDLKPAAIAEAAGMTANTAAKALQRIRDQLRECMIRKLAIAEVAS